MKHYFNQSAFLLIMLCFWASSCTKDKRSINLNLKPVTNLLGPVDNSFVDLSIGSTTKFEWQPTLAEDGSLVLYQVLFDKEDGDFSKPVYTVTSDGNGVQNTLSLTNVQLDHIAALEGANPLSETKLKWTVASSKGWNIVNSTESLTIQVKRGITLPQTLALSGSGTEGTSGPLNMTKISDGIFEIFTKLSAGDLTFTDETGASYGLQLDGGTYKIVSGSKPTGLTGDKIVWLRINFGNSSAQIKEIKEVTFWYCNDNEDKFELPYIGNGVWRKDNVPDFLSAAGWTSREDRYKYRMLINDGTGDSYYWINSFSGDPAGQDGQYPSTLDYRAINLGANNGSQWDWGWKLDRNYLTVGSSADYWIEMNGSEKYNQNYQKD